MLHFCLTLTTEQMAELEKALKSARIRGKLGEVTKITAILAIAESGESIETIAEILRVSAESVRTRFKKYVIGGVKYLIERKSKKRKKGKEPGSPSKLDKKQRKELENLIERGPEKAGFPGACRRTPMIQELILKKFNVFYNARYISELLKKMGFSYQKARFAVGGNSEENEEKRRVWKTVAWPEILAEAKKKNAYLLFGDEASFPQWGALTYTWAKKGKQPEIKTSGKRKGYKVLGLIEYFSGRFFYQTQEGRLNSEAYIAFLTDILKKTRKRIVLAHDGASCHVSKAVAAFIAERADRLTVHKPPSYSPDFNPIEKLWKKVKEKETHLQYFPTFESLKDKINSAMLRFSNSPSEILSLFGFYTKMETS